MTREKDICLYAEKEIQICEEGISGITNKVKTNKRVKK